MDSNISKTFLSSKRNESVISTVFAENVVTKMNLKEVMADIKGKKVNEKISLKGDIKMTESVMLEFTRKELYDEIWKISAAGVAKKYELHYAHMLKQLKDLEIPVPPSGYWMKINSGKDVSVIELSGEKDRVIQIYNKISQNTINKATRKKDQISKDVLPELNALSENKVGNEELLDAEKNNSEVETIEIGGKIYNIYNREHLYQEIWEHPITDVAKKYLVSDVMINKICKSLNIPTPPAGYWSKIRSGKSVKKPILPKGDYPIQRRGLQTRLVENYDLKDVKVLAFLDEEDRKSVLSIAEQVLLTDFDDKKHSTIIAHKRKVKNWQSDLKKNIKKGRGRYGLSDPPFLADTVAEESLPRVYRILDTIIKALEPFDCKIASNLIGFIINGELVFINIKEVQTKAEHIPTKEENLELLKYEEDRHTYSYASKPRIRKYDYIYNGRINFTINNKRVFRDCNSYSIEDRIGDIIVALYEESDIVRQRCEEREEAERQREMEQQRKEEQRKRYDLEVDNTNALVNAAGDYEIACKIRKYIKAVKNSKGFDESYEWIEWANKKADWYDPTIASSDDFFGVREHEKNLDEKNLKKNYSHWW